jgi:hypothetical protein
MKLRSWTVPPGSKFVCVPQDGDGMFIAEAGAQVVIVGRDTWEQALAEAMAEMTKKVEK